MYHYVLFDLDGTLTDPKEGICKSAQYALHDQNIEEVDLDKLEPFIGPPLATSFREFYGMDEEQTEKAVRKFRERFETVGIFENELYPGMEEFLAGLYEKGIHLAIASSKPKEFVERILEHFKIRQYFQVVAGSEKDGRKVEKADVIREALGKLFQIKEEAVVSVDVDKYGSDDDKNHAEMKKRAKRILPVDDILMVGDRKFDVLGAQAFFLDSAGVSYGYAAEGELEAAGADYITDNLEELWTIITGETGQERRGKVHALQKSIRILSPILYDYLFSFLITAFILTGVLEFLLAGPLKAAAGWFEKNSGPVAVCFDAVSAVLCIVFFVNVYRKEKYRPISQVVKRRNDKKLKRAACPLLGFAICLALFLNIIFVYLSRFAVSSAYEETAAIQYSVPLALGLVYYGLIKPLEEELVFRGLVYGRMRKYFSAAVSIPVSALLFGAYHGNLVQLTYAYLMGCLLAWAFEKYKSLKASLMIHSGVNLVVYVTSSISCINQVVFSKMGFIITGILTIAFFLLLMQGNVHKQKKILKKTNKKLKI